MIDSMHKQLGKPKVWVATKDKNSIVYEFNYSNWKARYFAEYKRSLK